MPAAIAIPLIAAGIGGGASIGSSLIGKSASSNATKAALNDPNKIAQTKLIDQQTTQGKVNFDEAQQLLPTLRGAIDLPFNQYQSILSGDPSAFNKTLAPMNSAIDKQSQAARRNIAEFAPHGAIAGQLSQLNTQAGQAKQGGYWNAWQQSLLGAQQGAGQYQGLFNSLNNAGQAASSSALGAIGGIQSNQTALELQKQASSAQALGGLGTGIGQILTGLLLPGNKGNSRQGSGSNSPSGGGGYDSSKLVDSVLGGLGGGDNG